MQTTIGDGLLLDERTSIPSPLWTYSLQSCFPSTLDARKQNLKFQGVVIPIFIHNNEFLTYHHSL